MATGIAATTGPVYPSSVGGHHPLRPGQAEGDDARPQRRGQVPHAGLEGRPGVAGALLLRLDVGPLGEDQHRAAGAGQLGQAAQAGLALPVLAQGVEAEGQRAVAGQGPGGGEPARRRRR